MSRPSERAAWHELLAAVVEQHDVTKDPADRSELLAFVAGVFRSILTTGTWPGLAALVVRAWRPGKMDGSS